MELIFAFLLIEDIFKNRLYYFNAKLYWMLSIFLVAKDINKLI